MRNEQRGAVAVEVVLLAPLLLVFVFLIIEMGFLFGAWLVMTNSAREGTRLAITKNCNTYNVDPIRAQIRSRVQQTASPYPVNAVDCTGSYDSCIDVKPPQPQGTEVMATVEVRYKWYTLMPITGTIPFLGSINYPGYLEVIGLSTMRCE